MKTLYLDLFSGISGDMFIGALVDLGLEPARLESELQKLGVSGYHLHVRRAHKSSIAGTKFDVHLDSEHGAAEAHAHGFHQHAHGHGHSHAHEHGQEHSHDTGHDHEHPHSHEHSRNFTEIQSLIEKSSLSAWVKQKATAIFHRIAVAEGAIHGVPPEKVEFHEVGAVDSIVDIVGACIALELLGQPKLLASPVVEGWGWLNCAHGRFPIPAPATISILAARGISVSQCEEPHELVTPTGAALLAELVESFKPLENFTPQKIGFGLGTRDNKTRPNVLRAILGETAPSETGHDWETDRIAILETNLDDVSSEILGHFVESALAEGALDVFHTPIQMKKNRPGVVLTLLCNEADADRFTALILVQTSAFGVRRHLSERRKLRRDFVDVKTPHGPVTVKIGRLDGRIVQTAPEYESCRKLAEQTKVPLKEIYAAASRSAAGCVG